MPTTLLSIFKPNFLRNLCLVVIVGVVSGDFTTTLEGPFRPVTAPLDDRTLNGLVIDLPEADPQLQTNVEGFQPQQISVALSFGCDSVWISWITGDFQIGNDVTPLDPESVSSVVQYGTLESQSMSEEATGYSIVYNQLYPVEGFQNYTSGIIHHVRLTGLEPGTLYQYQCGDPSISAMSNVYYFQTMPVSSTTSFPSRVAVVGDLGLTYNTSKTLSQLISNHPDLVVLVGGLSYADVYLTDGTMCNASTDSSVCGTYQPRWDYWGRFMQPLLANIPTMVVGGKHEMELQADDQIFAAYSSRFTFPSEESSSSSTLFYSFNAGGIHFVVLNPYISYDKSSDQFKWLQQDLYNVDRGSTPWLVATWYTPWYSTFADHYREAECMRVELEDLLYAYRVDIVFNGHVHAYERSNRVYNYSLDPCGPVYITTGAGGSVQGVSISHADDPDSCPEPSSTSDNDIGGFCAFNFTSGPATGSFCWDRQPDYSAYRDSSFGHGLLEVKNETYAVWSWHRNQDYYGRAADILYIVREPDRCLPDQPN